MLRDGGRMVNAVVTESKYELLFSFAPRRLQEKYKHAGERGGVKLQDGKPVTTETNAILTDMLTIMRDAIDDLDDLPHDPGCGWEQNEPACDFGCEPGKLCEPTKTWRAEAARKNY